MLLLKHVLEDRVEINSPNRFIYGFQLKSNVEKYLPLSLKTAMLILQRGLASNDVREQVLSFAFYRKKLRNADAYKNELYLFTFSENFAKFIEMHLSTYKRLSGIELANAIYRLHTLDDDVILDGKVLRRTAEIFTENFLKFPPVENLYKKLAQNAFSKRDLVAYVGASINDVDATDYTNLLITDWEGVLWITMQFADFTRFLEGKKLTASGPDEKRAWEEILRAYKTKLYLVGIETVLVGEEKKLSVDLALSLMNAIGFVPKKKEAEKEKLLFETPLKWFDVDYEFVEDVRAARKLIPITLEKYTYAKDPLFAGINVYKTYTNFSPFEDCSAPHSMAIAPTGSGKSVFLCLQTKNALNVDTEKLVKLTAPPRISEDVRIRYFDKGYTSEVFFKLLEYRGVDVFRFSTNLKEIRINPCEIQDEDTDFDFSVHHVSTILRSMGLPPLEGGEIIVYKTALWEVYKNDKYKYVLNLQIKDLKEKAPKIYERLKREGVDDHVIVKELVKENPQRYWYLRQPILSDVFRFLKNEAEYSSLFENKEDVRRTVEKIARIKNLPEFNFLSEIDVRNAKVVYVDLDPLEASQFFVPIVLGILKKLIYFDKYQKPTNEKAYYFFDEAHTLLKFEEFAQALETAVREVRKFKMSMNFATQNWKEIPPQVIANVCIRYFLTPKENTESKKKELINEYVRHLGLQREDVKDLEDVYLKLGNYFIAVVSDRGLFSLKIPPAPIDLKLFKADEPYFLLENERVAIVREKRLDAKTRKELENKGYMII